MSTTSPTPTPTAPLPRCPVCGWEWRDGLPATEPLYCPRPSCGVELGRPEDPAGGPLRVRTFRLVDGYSICVLPFSLREDADLPATLGRLEAHGRWARRVFSLADPEDVERTEYFLPYVRRFLFPSLFEKAGEDGRRAAGGAPTCAHYTFDLARLGAAGTGGVPLVLSARDPRRRMAYAWALRLESVELIVFGYRVGFLLLRFRPDEPGASLFDQMDALTFLRTIAPLYRGFEMPELAPPGGPHRYSVPQLLAFLLAEFEDTPAAPPGKPERIAPGPTLPVRPIYDDRMMVYSFSCLDREACLADPDHCRDLLRRAAVVNFDEEPQLPPGEPEAGDLAAWLRLRWQGTSKDGGVLVVFNSDRFHERFLGTYHGTYYFDIFLLAALQRVTLLTLFERLSDIPGLTTPDARSRRQMRRVRRDLLLFKNQCWFSQITNRERGLVLWRRWQEVFEVQTLLQEVNEQSNELEAYLQSQHRERVEWLLRIGGFVATAVPAIFGLELILGQWPYIEELRWALLALLFLAAGGAAWYVMFRRPDES